MRVHLYLLACILSAQADLYLHNPRGSNNRLDENGRARNNANRLFDSQNNNRGGYNVGSLYYYEGSKLQIEWTNQHSCASSNNHCELILQYMCGDQVRDGSTTSTIPENYMACEKYDCNSDTRYGMHENYDYYMNCKTRKQNEGLYLINQRRKGKSAKYTRQNPNGNRRGYECPEERDYYPYWHPTPWRDIAVMTNDPTRCPYYEAESHNVKDRWACVLPRDIVMLNIGKLEIPNNKEECEAFRFSSKINPNGTRAEWKRFPALGLPPPVCRETEFSRDNHLGNGPGGYTNTFNWTIPNLPHERCVLRMRYNISTGDYEAWDSVNATQNDRNRDTRLDLSGKYGFPSRQDAEGRGYRLINNPQVQIFPELNNVKFRLALNTAQYGRTFQDRSHTFAIRSRPASLAGTTIHNVNVRGKRGNIVQVYPGVEYDFVPNTLKMGIGEHVHFQWTGSNSNPHNNDGQGRAGTDRSNVILQRLQAYHEGTPGGDTAPGYKFGHWGRSYPETVTNTTFLGLAQQDLMDLALLTSQQFRGEMSELDDAGTYFDLGPRKVTSNGVYHYMCTRNNNFSNRSQKGRIICQNSKIAYQAIGWNGGNLTSSVGDKNVMVNVPQGTFTELKKVEVQQWSTGDAEVEMMRKGRKNPVGGSYSSLFTVIKPEQQLAADDKTFEVAMSVDNSGAQIYKTTSDFATWTKVSSVKVDDGVARFAAREGGVYVAVYHTNVGMIVGIVIGVLVLIGVLVGAAVVYMRKQPGTTNAFLRSCQGKV